MITRKRQRYYLQFVAIRWARGCFAYNQNVVSLRAFAREAHRVANGGAAPFGFSDLDIIDLQRSRGISEAAMYNRIRRLVGDLKKAA